MTSPSTTKTNPRVIALIAAAGQGTRLGADVPKAYVELRGRTLLERSVRTMANSGLVDEVIVLVSPAMEGEAGGIVKRVGANIPVRLVHGGGERADSIWAGLQAIPDEDAVVLIHDAARALTPTAMVERVARRVLAGAPAVIPVLPVTDTIKEVAGDSVIGTPDRARLRAVQTPQGFRLAALRQANLDYWRDQPDFTATDDASLMEWHGQRVETVPGDILAFKITTPTDLTLAHALAEEQHD
ncbi:2-C-methyl-D-erythritol 4-phosphate cytidylyltransferase [Corynebacterium accolens]|uniref:2-C-methyl-D-erythritol 4-phosphate cytidylyltransferase n=1 Tax=Corynebacterium accolens TaxID=38284 RepID=A0ABT7FMS9_9CORY|nr:2-C-methyl-D-erythritol 4-phosphate cytidylyltransferase [Corynebacterium accolens]MDK4246640.1 2-C-methyl-D-erythritol 4-phosphate cytidylyltransferase [Corynebacterium accolens]MDK4266823.1 2-C-methyl-D-erythritol 4-phosphate cytidylyltransferase [Corynebacterium accolens]MDK4308445.1 2-C-methyl-D-erythritol 4-phosphate cytidylyltransferase [Corynebacterium accolens]MDK4324118.1 2-C-methyl-D-erythritol 4-phosphate cytidylyltransferase [Corynebacterium accolens]WKS66676.1 2-C-methyl-D-eryt